MESEVFDGLQVILKSGLSKVTALEFLALLLEVGS